MKNKLILLGMILSFQLMNTGVFGQSTRTVQYPNYVPNNPGGGEPNIPGSLLPNPSSGFMFLSSHKFLYSSHLKKPEICYLNNNLEYEAHGIYSFDLPANRGAVLHEAKLLPNSNNIYAIVGSYTTADNSDFENEAFVFLWDMENKEAVSHILSLGVNMSLPHSTAEPVQMTAGVDFVNLGNGLPLCMVVHSNSRQPRQDGVTYGSSTLNLIQVIPNALGYSLHFDHAYDMQPRNLDKAHLDGKDMAIDGEYVYLLSTTFSYYSTITKSKVQFNNSTGLFEISTSMNNDNPMLRIGSSPLVIANSHIRLELNKINIVGDRIILTGNQGGIFYPTNVGATVETENGIILEGFKNDIFSSPQTAFDKVFTYSSSNGSITKGRSSLIDPTNSERLFLYSSTNVSGLATPAISYFNRNSSVFDFVQIQNQPTRNSIAFVFDEDNGGINKYWAPMCVKNNKLNFTSLESPQNNVEGLKISYYPLSGNGFVEPDETNTCAIMVNFTISAHSPYYVSLEYEPDEIVPDQYLYPFTKVNLELESVVECENVDCESLVVSSNSCDEIKLVVNGLDSSINVDWNDNISGISNFPSLSIRDLECHRIEYTYNGFTCFEQFKACLTPGVCEANQRSKITNQTEMTRWTLDNNVTEFSAAQKQMKDGNKHTLCYEKYNNKTQKFEQISCEEVQATDDLSKVEFDFTAYPSPASDQITIEVTNFNAEDNYKAVLFTNSGGNVKEFKLKSKSAQYSLEGVNSGSYLLTMYQGNKKVSSKTIIVRK